MFAQKCFGSCFSRWDYSLWINTVALWFSEPIDVSGITQGILLCIPPLQEAEPTGLKGGTGSGKLTYMRHLCGFVARGLQQPSSLSWQALPSPHRFHIKGRQWLLTPELLNSFPCDFSKASAAALRRKGGK